MTIFIFYFVKKALVVFMASNLVRSQTSEHQRARVQKAVTYLAVLQYCRVVLLYGFVHSII